MKQFFKILALAALALPFTGCDVEYSDINILPDPVCSTILLPSRAGSFTSASACTASNKTTAAKKNRFIVWDYLSVCSFSMTILSQFRVIKLRFSPDKTG